MAQPTSNTRGVAHFAVGVAGGYVTSKMLGRGGPVVFVVGAMIVVYLHAVLDAPVAKGMASVGLQF